MEDAVRRLAIIHFVVIGLSHILQHRAWAEFFIALRRKGPLGSFVNGFITLGVGSIVVAFHNVWTGIPLLLTLVGWGQVVKGLLCFVRPSLGLASMSRVSLDKSRGFIVVGLAMLALGGLLAYSDLRT